jgi:carbon storage regulator
MLILTRRIGESFYVGDDILITLNDIRGESARISITAPRDIPVLRKELRDAKEENISAAAADTSGDAVAELMKKMKK